MEYFQSGTQSQHAKFHVEFCNLYEYLDLGIEPCVMALLPRLNEYDFSPQTKGHGYRSLLRIVQKCCLSLIQLSRHITVNRDSILFRRAYYLKELEAYVQTVGQLRACLYYAQQVMNYCQEGSLFADEETLDHQVADKLMMEFEMLNQDCFYGRCLGFQFCESMQRPLQMVAIAMASFSEGYQETSQFMQLASTVFNSGKYIMNPDLRGKQVVNVTRSADVKFCKAFWGIPESDLLQQLPSWVCPYVEVDEVLQLGPDSFEMMLEDGTDTVMITPPCAHTGPSSVKVRLISYNLRDGQVHGISHLFHMKPNTKNKSGKPQIAKPKSPGLLIHCHGGGFVAQSSKSHEVYLRHWARDIGVPILSIDYSLAPEFPFPRALEECFYAYSWALQNYDKLGSTGKTILLAGDSAGGNLMISTAMRAASFGIRPPDGLLTVYPVVLARYTPSPARLMALMDPLLPVGILSRCLADVPHSYLNSAVSKSETSNITKVKSNLTLPLPRTRSVPSFQENRPRPGSMSPSDFARHRSISNSPLKAVRSIPIVKNPYMSPLLAPDELLKGLPDICIVGCHLDPLLDDSVMFAKKLKKLGKKVELELIDDLPHGFLNFSMASKDAKKASDNIIVKLRDMFKMDYITPKTNTPV
ncbi:hypothetical protein LOTGIDRAFT_113239 [Lottia gigantea]|uniref:Hormone-sensitive lipase n=1 Tax=Lottia gigantea TaxID=225164 RepID=V4A7L6_LOTGI|nr:hypothetical protein LOTGIDRAFT_113239 [Lottia gigantea]ESO99938.1 hypothetical protein LOTGIDRAFT_113239 [Lottia gigantea]